MLRYFIEYFKGKDYPRIERANRELLLETDYRHTDGTLYIDGEGTASAEVALAAAEVFNQGGYENVVIAGGKKPWLDIKGIFTFPVVRALGLPLPRLKDTEASYLQSVFAAHADPEKISNTDIVVIPKGKNAGAKITLCQEHFRKSVHIVTLMPTASRLTWTFLKQCGTDKAVTVDGIPALNMDKDTWSGGRFLSFLAYAFIMGEADKSGPRMDGRKPMYEDKFFTRVAFDELNRRARDNGAVLKHG